MENILEEEFYEHLDFNSAVEYLKGMTCQAFTVWVDILCLVYVGICSVSFVLYRGNGNNLVTFAKLTNILILNSIKRIIRSSYAALYQPNWNVSMGDS